MPGKARTQETTNEELGQHGSSDNENDGISQKSLDAFGAIVEDKLANVATKEC